MTKPKIEILSNHIYTFSVNDNLSLHDQFLKGNNRFQDIEKTFSSRIIVFFNRNRLKLITSISKNNAYMIYLFYRRFVWKKGKNTKLGYPHFIKLLHFFSKRYVEHACCKKNILLIINHQNYFKPKPPLPFPTALAAIFLTGSYMKLFSILMEGLVKRIMTIWKPFICITLEMTFFKSMTKVPFYLKN